MCFFLYLFRFNLIIVPILWIPSTLTAMKITSDLQGAVANIISSSTVRVTVINIFHKIVQINTNLFVQHLTVSGPWGLDHAIEIRIQVCMVTSNTGIYFWSQVSERMEIWKFSKILRKIFAYMLNCKQIFLFHMQLKKIIKCFSETSYMESPLRRHHF